MKNKVLLGIDLQYDFCNPQGNLFVKNADRDVTTIIKLLERHRTAFDCIIMSMDSHQPIHIAHQIYWKDREGKYPELFSNIKADDVRNGKWMPQYNSSEALSYLTKLESGGDVCTIWPPHCIIGTEGWNIDKEIFKELEQWSIATGNSYQLVNKGMHQSTEHYSIFKAAVEYPEVRATLFNTDLVKELNQYSEIIIVGQAADFCVANSLKDLLAKDPKLSKRIYMLTDCMSYIVEGSESAQSIFDHARSMGVTFCKSTDL